MRRQSRRVRSPKQGGLRGKRLVDVAISCVGLIGAGPLLGAAALAILIETGRPILFVQDRVGLDERLFRLYKLRTMVDTDHPFEQTFNRSHGVTRTGTVLRATKIDELPQLWNVLRGDMSLLGPRPCMPQTLDTMTPRERQRFTVRPGMTGLAQVNGNARLTWAERCEYDIEYIERSSWSQEVRILLATVGAILKGTA